MHGDKVDTITSAQMTKETSRITSGLYQKWYGDIYD
jgi:hypothetical protein